MARLRRLKGDFGHETGAIGHGIMNGLRPFCCRGPKGGLTAISFITFVLVCAVWQLISNAETSTEKRHSFAGFGPNFFAESSLPEFGFILPRCVRTATHNELWRENYRCIRALFPRAPVVVIDDYSDMALVDQNFTMTDAVVVPSELPPGKGEALPYLYFHKHRPFKKAVMLNDGMFLLQREPLWSALQNTTDYRFLWHFDYCLDCDIEAQLFLIETLRPEVQVRLKALQPQYSKWAASFASAAIMTWDFLDRLNATHGFLNMLHAVENRDHRKGLERLVGLASIHATGGMRPLTSTSVYGTIHAHVRPFSYSWHDYLRDKASGSLANTSAVKVWNGRRR